MHANAGANWRMQWLWPAARRDLCINLRITSSLAVALGVEMHMCEVQLLLKSVAEIKQTTGHKNYVKFRDSRAI